MALGDKLISRATPCSNRANRWVHQNDDVTATTTAHRASHAPPRTAHQPPPGQCGRKDRRRERWRGDSNPGRA